jgi:hypothetical protein
MPAGRRLFQTLKLMVAVAAVAALAGCEVPKTETAEMVSSGPAVTGENNHDTNGSKHGDVVRAPKWVVGSEWKYSDGYGLKVTDVKGDVTAFTRTDIAGRWLSRRGFLREASQSGTALRRVVYRSVPPDAGKSLTMGKPLVFQREYIANDRLRVHVTSWTVEGRESIVVPAGKFDTWLVVMRTRSLKTDWTGYERWWYSPRAHNYVRMEYKYGDAPESSRVLMSFSLAQDLG